MVKRSTSVLSFAPSPFVHFTESSRFLTEVQETAASAELVDATLARAMDVDGNLEGQDLRMTAAAFSDLCALTQLNEAYVRRVAQRNEPLAVDVIRDAMSCGLLRGCSYLVDKREKRIDAVVIDAKHNPPDYAALVRNALSASRETRFLGGWISGTRFRVTASAGDVRDVKTGKSAKVGDLVGTGFEILTDLGRPGCTSITDYAERLSCTNGMIARDKSQTETRLHDKLAIDDELLTAFLVSTERAKHMIHVARRATQHYFDGVGVTKVIERVNRHPLLKVEEVKSRAIAEAQRDCRKSGEICLWDFVNGVTDAAKAAKTLDSRREIEGFGYALMVDVLGD